MKWFIAAAAIGFVLPGISSAQQKVQTLEQLRTEQDVARQVEQVDKALDALNRLRAAEKSLSADKSRRCLMAFGDTRFCGCLVENMPVGFTFQDYISVTTRSKADNGYQALKPDDRKAYDMTAAARDKCVSAPGASGH